MSSDKSRQRSSEVDADGSIERSEHRKRVAADIMSILNRAGVKAEIVVPQTEDTMPKDNAT